MIRMKDNNNELANEKLIEDASQKALRYVLTYHNHQSESAQKIIIRAFLQGYILALKST